MANASGCLLGAHDLRTRSLLDAFVERLCPSTQQSGAAREAMQSLEGGQVSVGGFVFVQVRHRTTIADQID